MVKRGDVEHRWLAAAVIGVVVLMALLLAGCQYFT